MADDPSPPLPTCKVASADRLGEGPYWSAGEGRLYWFDIKSAALNVFDPASGDYARHQLPFRASAAVARAGGGLLMATEKGLAHWDPQDASLEIVLPVNLPSGFRTNDGGVDGDGAFWWSTMDDDGGRRPGVLFRTSPEGVTEVMVDGISIANTVCFSPDGARLYLADSARATLFVSSPDTPGGRKVFATTEDGVAPDGGAVDAEGYLWNAQWGGARLVRYAPDGRIDRIVPMPMSQPTSCAFGGADLDVLFITSAWDGLSDDARAAEPQAGHLFAFRPGVPGLPLPRHGSPAWNGRFTPYNGPAGG